MAQKAGEWHQCHKCSTEWLPMSSVGQHTSKRKGASKKRSHKIQKISTEADESAWHSEKDCKTIKVRHQARNPYEYCPNITSHAFTNAASHAPTMSESDGPFYLPVTFIHGTISVCYGCKQCYIHPVKPPNDLYIVH